MLNAYIYKTASGDVLRTTVLAERQSGWAAILLLFLADDSKQNQTKKWAFYVYIL